MCRNIRTASYNLILTGRRNDRLQAISGSLQQLYNVDVLPLAFDIQDQKACTDAINSLPEKWKAIDILVNNAGLALGRNLFDEASPEDWNIMIDTNIKGLLYMSKLIIPLMKNLGKGHIINLGSIAGKEVYERGNIYCATKFAVHAISRSMRIDLLQHRIKVTCINPGAAETEFSTVRFRGDEQKATSIYNGYKPLSAEDVAQVIYYTTTLPEHVCINDLDITCLAQANTVNTFKG